MVFRALVLFIIFHVFQASSYANTCSLEFARFWRFNPVQTVVGVAHIHEYTLSPDHAPRIVSIVSPFMPQGAAAHVADMAQSLASRKLWPKRFIFSDGFHSSPFIMVDLSPGSQLSLFIDSYVDAMKVRGVQLNNPEAVIDDLRYFGKVFFQNHNHSTRNLQSPLFEKTTYEAGESTRQVMFSEDIKRPANFVFKTNDVRPILPFEYYLSKPWCALCMQTSMIASFIFEKLGIQHRVRPGLLSFGDVSYENSGHTLIELADGRLLDLESKFLDKPIRHAQHSEWLKGPGWWWTPLNHYPYVVLDDVH